MCCYIASPGFKEYWKTEIPFQSLNFASFTGFPLKWKSIAFNRGHSMSNDPVFGQIGTTPLSLC